MPTTKPRPNKSPAKPVTKRARKAAREVSDAELMRMAEATGNPKVVRWQRLVNGQTRASSLAARRAIAASSRHGDA